MKTRRRPEDRIDPVAPHLILMCLTQTWEHQGAWQTMPVVLTIEQIQNKMLAGSRDTATTERLLNNLTAMEAAGYIIRTGLHYTVPASSEALIAHAMNRLAHSLDAATRKLDALGEMKPKKRDVPF